MLIILTLMVAGGWAVPTTRESSRDLEQAWGGFTPFKPTQQKDGLSMPWFGPPRSKASQVEEFPDLRSQLFQGDILIPEGDSRNAIIAPNYLWPQGIIPYRFAPGNFTANMTKTVHEAIRMIESTTCVRFVEHDDQPATIEFRSLPGRGCYAVIGYRPAKKVLPVNLQYPECFRSKGVIVHELLHVVGLLHEQARVDRDEHVTVHFENIEQIYWPEFARMVSKEVSTYDLPYDYTSVMHYPSWAFSKNGKSTITAKGFPSKDLGQRKGPTHVDLTKVRRMYKCSGAY